MKLWVLQIIAHCVEHGPATADDLQAVYHRLNADKDAERRSFIMGYELVYRLRKNRAVTVTITGHAEDRKSGVGRRKNLYMIAAAPPIPDPVPEPAPVEAT